MTGRVRMRGRTQDILTVGQRHGLNKLEHRGMGRTRARRKLTLSPDFDESESQTTNKRPELEMRIQPLACQAKYNGRGKKEQKKGGKATQGEWTAKQSEARLEEN